MDHNLQTALVPVALQLQRPVSIGTPIFVVNPSPRKAAPANLGRRALPRRPATHRPARWHPVGAIAASPLPPQEMRAHLETLKRLTEAEGRGFSALTISYKVQLYDADIPSPDGSRRPFSGGPVDRQKHRAPATLRRRGDTAGRQLRPARSGSITANPR